MYKFTAAVITILQHMILKVCIKRKWFFENLLLLNIMKKKALRFTMDKYIENVQYLLVLQALQFQFRETTHTFTY